MQSSRAVDWIRPERWVWLAVALVTGLGAFGVSLGLAELSTKRAVLLTASLLAFVSALVSGRAKQIFLFAWVVALTYNRNYFFTAFDADSSYGPFWGPADIPLLLLMVHWWVQAAIWKQPSVRRGGAMWMWIAPFAAACVLSLPGALRPDWTFYELARVARFLLILFYFRRQVGRAEWMTILAAFGTSVLIQAVMGIVYVATGKQLGLALLFGSGVDERDMIQMAAEGGLGQMRRGSGTIGHPNTLAVYFMMLSPMFMALSVSKIAARWRVMSAVVALIATAGTGVTMSRTSWLIHSAQWVVMGLGLTAFKMITPRQLLGGAAILALVAVIAITPFLGKIQERLTGDFGDMLDFRAKHNGIALEIWQRSPFFGVGLNNYSDILARYPEDELAIFREFKDYFRKMLDVRITAWVHNFYLLMLAETGLVGLTSFLLFIGGVTIKGLRAVARTGGAWRGVSFGLLIGTFGLHLHGLQESALWIDPVTYHFAVVAGLINVLPDLAAESPQPVPEGEQA